MQKKVILSANPGAGYSARKSEIDAAIAGVLESGWYILGKTGASFEQAFARYIGVRHGVGVASGTDALLLSLKTCGIGPGDAVVTVANTAVATVAAIVLSGATPVLVDIDKETFTLDPDQLALVVDHHRGLKIKAVVPVHLFGHPAHMSSILKFAEEHSLFVVEDCAQAHGAATGRQRVGSLGHLGAFSFYPTKNLGAFGDGGAVVCNDAAMHERLLMLRQYGWRERYISETEGMNSRLDEIQAAILQVKLRYLDEDNARRRAIAALYRERLSQSSLILPGESEGCTHVYHQFVVRTPRRDTLKAFLASNNIATSILYPLPIHLQSGYASLVTVGKGGLPVTEAVAKDLLCLPVYPELTDAEINHICETILLWQAKEL